MTRIPPTIELPDAPAAAAEGDRLDAEDLACMGGFRRDCPDWFREAFAELWAKPVPAPVPAPPRCRQRTPTLASVAKQANKAEIAVARYEVRPDGTVVVIPGTPEPSIDSNPWPLDDFKATKQ